MNPRDALCINSIRTLSIDAIGRANSGHPGLPLGAAPMAYVLWHRHLKHNPRNPLWMNRDRFVLSAGHGSMLLYSLLHLSGYDLPMSEIKNFRQWGSRTPGHPEFALTPGVEATTGPLGQGAANAVGMALAERALAQLFNRPGHSIIDHFTYALVSDGDLMEGVAAEAGSLAGHLKLGKLIYLYDANDVTLDGPTSLTFSVEDVGKRYESYGWHVLTVRDGDRDLDALDRAIQSAKAETARPSLIIVKTTIGFASPKAGTSAVHGSPLNPQEILATKKALGWESEEPFYIPKEAHDEFRKALERGARQESEWNERFAAYAKAHPECATLWKQMREGKLPQGWDDALTGVQGAMASRQASGKALNSIAQNIPWLIGGDADLGCSTNTVLAGAGSFEGQAGSGRNIHFGVREHAMASIANGICYHGGPGDASGLRPFVATFFCFADYMRPAIRLAAMNHLAPIYVFTHDSIGLGEDGPTHQPVEHLQSLRAMPGLLVFRPADAAETAAAWKIAIETRNRPVALVLTRQKLPALERKTPGTDLADSVARGAYVLREASGAPRVLLIATGSEVSLAIEAQAELESQGIPTRVVSMPSWELFSAQPKTYRDQVLPPSLICRISIEAGVTLGWERWVGERGVSIGINRFGASAPAEKLFEEYGFTAQNVVKTARNALSALSAV